MIWHRLVFLGLFITITESLSTGLENVAKVNQVLGPKSKRAQEVLMFGNQQNRRTDNKGASGGSLSAMEKRTLGASGLEDVKSALGESEAMNLAKQSNVPMYDAESFAPYDRNYLYGKIIMNEVGNELPSRSWDYLPYSRYYSYGDDRRKRSEKSGYNSNSQAKVASSSPSTVPSSSSPPTPVSNSPTIRSTPRPIIQAKRSPPSYPELRYKRALDEEILALLSYLENNPHNRNYRSYTNEEYENTDDDGNFVGLEDEDTRNDGWLDTPVYAPRHLSIGPEVTSSEIGIPRLHPINSYEQYKSQYSPPSYEPMQYGSAQYGSLYPQTNYYVPEKRLYSRKRSQGYDSYGARNLNDIVNFSQMLNSQPQGYSNYPKRILY